MEPILDIGVVDSVKQGTMIDILIAAGVVGIIVLCGVVIYKSVVPSTRGTRALADIRSTVQAVQMYYVYEGKWPVPEKGSTNLADVPGFNEYFTSLPNDPFGTEVVPNLRYYCNGDANTPATRWLLVSNGPDITVEGFRYEYKAEYLFRLNRTRALYLNIPLLTVHTTTVATLWGAGISAPGQEPLSLSIGGQL